ncbi:unnamed protein product [Adineta steineri]|uniref:Alpha-tubulin N-acetyltransferase n=1 Tax=Adineta steineri TaxID=433720 RepID=A0A813STA8_9BILA|nr:unnamed protein product [Adineta steineri]CAF3517182.1 unnamed protein product [Adineta steineri]
MEFPFDINTVLQQEITILNSDLQILNYGQTSRIFASDKLTSIIDAVGDASYKAQGLPGAITSTRKFRISDHRLYLIKNPNDHNNLGSVVGLLKVGTKSLYVHDSHGQVHERTPLCLLDFYVSENKQRSGYGKKLFEAMLQFEKCSAYELAIDRPSQKCLGFLQKHYNLSAPIRQVNNFVVFSGFFNRAPTLQGRKSSASRQFHDNNAPVDNFRRQEVSSWLLPSEKQRQQQPNRQLYAEKTDEYSNNRLRTFSDENYRQNAKPPIGAATINNNERKLFSAYPSPYSHYNNQNPPLNEPIRTNSISHSASPVARTYTSLFNENNPFPSLQRYNTNPIITPDKQTISKSPLNFTYQNYQSTTYNNSHQNIVVPTPPPPPPSQPLTSIYTFPSLIKPASNWSKPPPVPQHQQKATMNAASSGWRLFGVPH